MSSIIRPSSIGPRLPSKVAIASRRILGGIPTRNQALKSQRTGSPLEEEPRRALDVSGVQTGVAPGVAVNHAAFEPNRVRFSARPRHVEATHSGFVQSAEHQTLTLEMGVRLSQPGLQPTAAHVNRRFPEHSAHSGTTATRCRRGMTTEYVDQRGVTASRRCHSCVEGLRARLKTGRFWFDSRGWHGHARAASVRGCIAAALPP